MTKFTIENNIIRQEVSTRGGGIEISLRELGYPDDKMSAFQNYLGGGMLGSIANDYTVEGWRDIPLFVEVAKELSRYFHDLTNHEDDEWESATFEENQARAVSAY